MNRLVIFICGLFCFIGSYSQNLEFAKQQVKKLASPAFHGRGYVENGDAIASKYLSDLFNEFHLKSFGTDYFQDYEFDVNTFPGQVEVKLGEQKLIPGIDYIVNPGSASCKGSFIIERIDTSFIEKHPNGKSLAGIDFKDKFILLDTLGFGRQPNGKTFSEIFLRNKLNAKGIALISDKELVFSVRTFQLEYCYLQMKRSAIKPGVSNLKVNIESQMEKHKARNVLGYLSGEQDTFIVFTAHYDHLGHMGKKVYFPGANDNASGTAMVLDFMHEYATMVTIHKYSYAFMLFSGEEAGLLGSKYYVSNPLFPLEKIKLVVNLDMVGTGIGGITIFNGSNYPLDFYRIDSLNKALGLNLSLTSKGGSRNSDHYSFHEKKVKALYFLTDWKEMPYHSVNDRFDRLPFTSYEKLYKLIDQYLKTL